ncbi:hypothetical protein BpHYR1_017753 [Brachionus plicatilis]|uniref:Uncharacterized protein n=1 Tax=Brachionus plicatilis TaxID=10195 RepID=A0A3M7S6J8_BRAPC|nr:hypothetical protein BpHYR1_017753 [Brachionus plicatilis]
MFRLTFNCILNVILTQSTKVKIVGIGHKAILRTSIIETNFLLYFNTIALISCRTKIVHAKSFGHVTKRIRKSGQLVVPAASAARAHVGQRRLGHQLLDQIVQILLLVRFHHTLQTVIINQIIGRKKVVHSLTLYGPGKKTGHFHVTLPVFFIYLLLFLFLFFFFFFAQLEIVNLFDERSVAIVHFDIGTRNSLWHSLYLWLVKISDGYGRRAEYVVEQSGAGRVHTAALGIEAGQVVPGRVKNGLVLLFAKQLEHRVVLVERELFFDGPGAKLVATVQILFARALDAKHFAQRVEPVAYGQLLETAGQIFGLGRRAHVTGRGGRRRGRD